MTPLAVRLALCLLPCIAAASLDDGDTVALLQGHVGTSARVATSTTGKILKSVASRARQSPKFKFAEKKAFKNVLSQLDYVKGTFRPVPDKPACDDMDPKPDGRRWAPPDAGAWRGQPGVVYLHEDPPVVRFDGFVSEMEIQRMVSMAEPNLARSLVGQNRSVSPNRTSSVAFLGAKNEWHDPILRAIEDRISNLTNIPHYNQEMWQVLKYNVGQEYRQHNDFLNIASMPCGVRLATLLLYLSDVEGGGETFFPNIGLKVPPKKGSAVLWWDVDVQKVRDGADPNALDRLASMDHAALPVTKGVKWAANKWLHVYDFENNYCLGRLQQ